MKYLKSLYVQVLVGITLGITLGLVSPDHAVKMKILGDSFIALLKMLIGPIIFTTVVLGISHSGDMKKVGRVGGKALLYFETISNIALALGLVAVNVFKPGKGFNVDPSTLDSGPIAEYAKKAESTSMWDFLFSIIPKTFTDAFTSSGNVLQILFIALLFGYGLTHVGDKGKVVREFFEGLSQILFKIVHFLMLFAPIGAFGAMSFTIGKYGVDSLAPLAKLMGVFYLTCIVFILVVLGPIARYCGFSILKYIRYIREELFTVLGTSSSESVLAPMMEKSERLGCSKSVVGLVIPTGYSFNLDGTNIYLTMAAVFVAQALNIDLTIGEQLSLLLVATVTSQGASGVTGAGFITLAATLAVVPSVPVGGLALIFGIDRFMSEARALTNTIGNGVATIVISRWEKELDTEKLTHELNR
ncbi:dicarboxylate/amino acid:cation symporter [Peredibacter starrii]|uniref:Dicarboxylate/amino acid:cation symporter n=1 Tax=Peredibacter starrii TaxID=28202 RepID=A0AAX4HU34_9BACT|nr:dicarboxylate/amino acid:cation symporter [Peredibacter starrii]WPU66895.1 dicarboxylate/amino acid:cation symporter [Peredibacter starrii]